MTGTRRGLRRHMYYSSIYYIISTSLSHSDHNRQFQKTFDLENFNCCPNLVFKSLKYEKKFESLKYEDKFESFEKNSLCPV